MPRPIARCAIAISLLWTFACAEPPSKEMNQAQGAIDAARAAGAEQYAAADFTAAVDALKRADEAAAQRDYRLALNHALDSRDRAQNAAKAAGLARARARGNAERLVAEVATLLTQAHARMSDDAAAKVSRRAVQEQREIVDAVDKRLQEARTAIAAEDYPAAVKAATGLAAQLQAVLRALGQSGAQPSQKRRR
jgi:hypothetical protein